MKFEENNFKEFLTSAIYSEEFTLKDLDISARVLQNWDEKGILPDKKRQVDENHKFNFIDLIWLKIIKDLRAFGYPLDCIKTAKEILLKKKPLYQVLGITDENKIDKIPELRTLKISYFDILTSYTLLKRKSIELCFLSGGGAFFSGLDVKEEIKQQEILKYEPVIKIPFFKYFTNFIEEEKNYAYILKNDLLSLQEQKIIEILRNKKFISIMVHKKNGEPFLVEAKSLMKLNNNAMLHDIILKKGFESIKIKTQDGDVFFAEKETKYTLK